MGDTGKNLKFVNFAYICLYDRPIKVVSVDKKEGIILLVN